MSWINPNYRDDQAYQSAEKWFAGREYEKFEDPDLALEYARGQYNQSLSILSSLDSKAEALFRLTASLPAVVATLIGVLDEGKLGNVYLTIPLFILLVSAGCCVVCRRTAYIARPMSGKQLMGLGPDYKPKQILAASFEGAAIGVAILANWKATWVDWSMWLCLAGVASFVVLILISQSPGFPA